MSKYKAQLGGAAEGTKPDTDLSQVFTQAKSDNAAANAWVAEVEAANRKPDTLLDHCLEAVSNPKTPDAVKMRAAFAILSVADDIDSPKRAADALATSYKHLPQHMQATGSRVWVEQNTKIDNAVLRKESALFAFEHAPEGSALRLTAGRDKNPEAALEFHLQRISDDQTPADVKRESALGILHTVDMLPDRKTSADAVAIASPHLPEAYQAAAEAKWSKHYDQIGNVQEKEHAAKLAFETAPKDTPLSIKAGAEYGTFYWGRVEAEAGPKEGHSMVYRQRNTLTPRGP